MLGLMDSAFRAMSRTYLRDDFRLPPEGRRVVDAVSNVLRASVVLHDTQKGAHHQVARTRDRVADARGWISFERFCRLGAQINNRWRLLVISHRTMLPDAETLVKWAATKLAAFLPVKVADDEPAVPPGGSGGDSGGSAEVGIPVWWARRTRN